MPYYFRLKICIRMVVSLSVFFLASVARADSPDLNPYHPDRYTVVEGDNLWNIAGKFLNDPWKWPKIWHDNPAIENPHDIYPGDVISLTMVEGSPRLQIETPSELRLSPQVRSNPLNYTIPAIPINVIGPFLSRPQVINQETLESLPYVVDFQNEHIVVGSHSKILVRSIYDMVSSTYTIIRAGGDLRDYDTGEPLGQEALYVAEGVLNQAGDPATLTVKRSELEVRIGDRLTPVKPQPLLASYVPHAPRRPLRGHIMTVLGGVNEIGQYSIVSIDKGEADGMEVGNVLEILRRGKPIRDTVSPRYGDTVMAPDVRAGLMLVFQTYRRISYGLVLKASHFIHVDDIAQSP